MMINDSELSAAACRAVCLLLPSYPPQLLLERQISVCVRDIAMILLAVVV
jgi:hypothetical protein